MYVIIGGTGFFGTYIVRAVQELTDEEIMIVSRTADIREGGNVQHITCDVSKRENLDSLISTINSVQKPCKIIYLSACHNPEQVEADPWMSWNTNVIGLNYLLSKIDKKAVFIFASTEAVYGNSQDGYRYKESDKPDPVNLYGIQKMAGEVITAYYGGHSMRYTLLAGLSAAKGRKHFWDTVLDNLRNSIPVELFSDTFRSMLDFRTAACLTVQLIEKHGEALPPIVNICGDETLSKYEVGMRLIRKYKLPDKLIIPIEMAEENRIFKTRRALSIIMDNTLLKTLLSAENILIDI